MLKKVIATASAVAALSVSSFAVPNDMAMVHITTSQFTGGSGTRVLSADTMYYLAGNVVVPAGWTLQIRPGTRIYGTFSADDVTKTSILIMAPNSVLLAEGKPDSTIVFSGIRDEVSKDQADFGPGAKGLWGGILWCGEAPISRPTAWYPEGIPSGLSGVYYGGSRPHYYGGKMKYVSIRHGGCALASNSETNGLSLYGIGDSTVIERVEAFANSDDGFEFFGGTVNTKYLVSTFCNDDQFDLDEGYLGKNQFWFAIEQEYEGDRGGEFDGKIDAGNSFVSRPTIYNYTFIGQGSTGTDGILLRDSIGGTFCNGIITEFGGTAVKRGRQSDGYNVIAKPFGNSGDSIRMAGNIFYKCNSGTWATMISPTSDIPYLKANSNDTVNPRLRGIGRNNNSLQLDPRPAVGSPALTGYVALPADPFFSTANYRGAFATNNLWIADWTALDQTGISTKLLTLTPANEEIGRSTDFMRMNFYLKQPGASVSSSSNPNWSIKVDGVEVKSIFFTKALNYPLADGGFCFYVQYNNAVSFIPPGVAVVGTHTVDVTMPLTTGQILKAKTQFKFLQ